jgi:multiple sugar transport system substrate-binding protein
LHPIVAQDQKEPKGEIKMFKSLTRREFLRGVAAASAAGVLGACAPKIVEVEKVVKETVVVKETIIVEGEEKVVEKVVEVEKLVTPTAVPATALKGEVVTVWKDNDGWSSPVGLAKVKMFNELYPGIELVGIGAGGDYPFVQKVTTMIAGGTPPDLMAHTAGRISALGGKYVFERLEPRVEASSVLPRVKEHMPQWGEGIFMGKLVGLAQDQNISLWFYNKDLFDQAGVDYPSIDWTWDDMVEIGLKVTDADNNQFLFEPGTHSYQDASMWFWQAGGTLFSENGWHTDLDKEPNILSMEFLVDLFVKHKVVPAKGAQLGEIGVSFDTGKLAMTSNSTGALAQQLGDKATWDFDWSAVFAPTGPGGGDGFAKCNVFSIGQGAKNADLAWVLMEWWFTDETQTAFAEMGEVVARNDIFKAVGLPNLPAHLHPALERSFEKGRALEREPGWSLCQKYWKDELDPAYLGQITAREAMMNAFAKAQPELEIYMEELGAPR